MPALAPTKPKPLTEKQGAVLGLIEHAWRHEQQAPTMQEMAAALGVSKPTIFDHVAQLERKGWVTRDPFKSRSIRPICGTCPCCARKFEDVSTVAAD